MGKYIRKCKGIGEVAVMEVGQVAGVRTRARALAMAAAADSSGTVKRRKVSGGGELKFASSYEQLRNRRGLVILPENSVSEAPSGNSGRVVAEEDQCSSPSSDHVSASCCSSNGSSELVKERLKFADLEEESVEIEASAYSDYRERRETTPSSELRAESDDLESTARPSEANYHHRSTVEKMPSESELEEFFAAAEKDVQKRFSEKYNYDIVKDVPMEGRYEWVRLKP
ncbi:hypothetical protein PVL29_026976 [Vitis rotundifolia]|uniref:Cyclin-dependent kinase inhibitor domain-containing protein n=1 Tax=Vitis rotundifolia TaxID=103349 RepID=A0AA38YHX0_VITRO|nr:hypothetical protein PVL29_026976 [Vitis rotundifolia]